MARIINQNKNRWTRKNKPTKKLKNSNWRTMGPTGKNLGELLKALAQSLQHHLRRLRVRDRSDGITVTWLFITAVLPFVHLRFGSEVIDPFLNTSMPMRTDSFVWMLCSGIMWVTFSVFVYRAVQVRFKTFVLLWLVYCIYDLLMFIWAYNQIQYYYIPYLIMLLIAFKLFKK
jgi:hypothetical protein